ncbi:Unconventional myosin-XV [Portunus trituberculatus]|uniref:Unconventional myosin-XV n=1 Tax=Portunus trituberculatus TaxID=210409 RepID=A0A5B7E0P4_PORTR|nr:Unconventional myosin-XV [Portunus trituberculatus]
MLHDFSIVQQPSDGQPQGQLLSPTESPWGGVVPPPPPMPTHLNPEEMAAGGFLDPYQRAKTVRIGKWRWPPPKGEEDPNDSFLQFKIRQQSKKMSKQGEGKTNGHSHSHAHSAHSSHNTSRDKIDGKEKGARKRRDSWGNPVDDAKSKEGIGKLKISREMREKLEALTSSHPSRSQKGPVVAAQQQKQQTRGIKKLEAHRRNLLQHQLEGDNWGSVNSIKKIKPEKGGSVPPPPPVAPANMYLSRRPPSPTASLSSQESTPVIPQTRSPPPPIQPPFRSSAAHDFADSASERRQSVSTMHTEKTEHFELEESSEFLQAVDSAPVLIDEELEKRSYEGLKTCLLPAPHTTHLTYNRRPWSLVLRKELFAPGEVLHGEALHLVFCQVVLDVYTGTTPRITPEQQVQMRKMLDNRGITPNNTFSPHHKNSVKREIIELAKTWPLYFAAIFPVTGSRKTGEVEMLAVSHSGVKLLRKEQGHHLTILSSYK